MISLPHPQQLDTCLLPTLCELRVVGEVASVPSADVRRTAGAQTVGAQPVPWAGAVRAGGLGRTVHGGSGHHP